MRNIGRFVLAAAFLSMAMPERGEAGAWTQKRYYYYVRVTANAFESEQFFDKDSQRMPYGDGGRFRDVSLYAYWEYGISPLVTFVGSIPYKTLEYRSPTLERQTNGAGDLYFGIRYLLSDRGAVSSLQGALRVNTGYETDLSILDQAPPLGDGQTDFELNLLIGNSIFNYVVYYNLEAGYRVRSGAPVDEVPFTLEAGVNLGKLALIIGKLIGVRAIAEAQSTAPGVGSQISLSPVEDYLKVNFEFIWNASPSVEVAAIAERVLDGRNTAAGATFGVALSLRGRAR